VKKPEHVSLLKLNDGNPSGFDRHMRCKAKQFLIRGVNDKP
jgi:hypothetical protein